MSITTPSPSTDPSALLSALGLASDFLIDHGRVELADAVRFAADAIRRGELLTTDGWPDNPEAILKRLAGTFGVSPDVPWRRHDRDFLEPDSTIALHFMCPCGSDRWFNTAGVTMAKRRVVLGSQELPPVYVGSCHECGRVHWTIPGPPRRR